MPHIPPEHRPKIPFSKTNKHLSAAGGRGFREIAPGLQPLFPRHVTFLHQSRFVSETNVLVRLSEE